MKLNRLIARHKAMGRTAALRLIAARRITVNGQVITDGHAEVSRFCTVLLDTDLIRPPERALYVMMHKPVGWLSATVDQQHPTVLDLIHDPNKHTLHLAGRLDRGTSGLLLLTNDGHWSNRLINSSSKVPKVYRVETHEPVPQEAVAAFARGFYFHTEDITTLPAKLEITGPRTARVTLHEGRYHQVKRMFHRVGCRVASLHRESVGNLRLPDDLKPGDWREMTPEEVQAALSSSEAV